MSQKLVWAVCAALVAGIAVFAVVTAEPVEGPIFIASNQPVTEDAVRQKLLADGWSNVQIARQGRYLEAIASKDGRNNKIVVDTLTGRLRADDDDDD